jgi:RNA recognition motif-containing protein
MPKLFIGGLSWGTTDETLRERFTEFGEVLSATVIMDRESGRSRGFGFVEYAEMKDAEAAVEGMRDQGTLIYEERVVSRSEIKIKLPKLFSRSEKR